MARNDLAHVVSHTPLPQDTFAIADSGVATLDPGPSYALNADGLAMDGDHLAVVTHDFTTTPYSGAVLLYALLP